MAVSFRDCEVAAGDGMMGLGGAGHKITFGGDGAGFIVAPTTMGSAGSSVEPDIVHDVEGQVKV